MRAWWSMMYDEVDDDLDGESNKMIIDDGGNDDKWLRRWIILRRIILMINDVANNMIDD